MSRQHRKNIKKYNTIRQVIKAQISPFGGNLSYFDVCSFGVFVRKTKHWPRATDLDLAAI